jgi:uncharacterized membrane protein
MTRVLTVQGPPPNSLGLGRAYPALIGIACGILWYVFGPQLFQAIHAKQGALENIFVVIFTLGTFAASFGLTIYTFLLTTESGFIGRAKKSIYYRHLLTYVLLATIANALVSFISMPGMVIKEPPHLT